MGWRELIEPEILRILLVFARIGAALMVVPGFGEVYVLPRLRLLLALILSILLAPILGPALPAGDPGTGGGLVGLVIVEIGIGLLIGAATRMAMVALHLGGSVIASQSGLASAVFFDPHDGGQGSIGSNFLTIVALALLFAADAHHALLHALVDSYGLFAVGAVPIPADGAELLSRLLVEATAVGLRIAGPVMLVGLALSVALGALNRMVPAFQMLFVATPAQLLLSLGALMLSLAAGLQAFLGLFDRSLLVISGG
ncbi:MAG TPA: flagellar biosynthetic protein FliR [Geminicoccaceae bacterium]|nr:flagellar biosynthetic protein FliR [Geminicoccus sp.]HMU49163.1 flagellar biosynthetic protein FliR [Geminicoccaceae bacterium]